MFQNNSLAGMWIDRKASTLPVGASLKELHLLNRKVTATKMFSFWNHGILYVAEQRLQWHGAIVWTVLRVCLRWENVWVNIFTFTSKCMWIYLVVVVGDFCTFRILINSIYVCVHIVGALFGLPTTAYMFSAHFTAQPSTHSLTPSAYTHGIVILWYNYNFFSSLLRCHWTISLCVCSSVDVE